MEYLIQSVRGGDGTSECDSINHSFGADVPVENAEAELASKRQG
jgi:hypothetical protein